MLDKVPAPRKNIIGNQEHFIKVQTGEEIIPKSGKFGPRAIDRNNFPTYHSGGIVGPDGYPRFQEGGEVKRSKAVQAIIDESKIPTVKIDNDSINRMVQVSAAVAAATMSGYLATKTEEDVAVATAVNKSTKENKKIAALIRSNQEAAQRVFNEQIKTTQTDKGKAAPTTTKSLVLDTEKERKKVQESIEKMRKGYINEMDRLAEDAKKQQDKLAKLEIGKQFEMEIEQMNKAVRDLKIDREMNKKIDNMTRETMLWFDFIEAKFTRKALPDIFQYKTLPTFHGTTRPERIDYGLVRKTEMTPEESLVKANKVIEYWVSDLKDVLGDSGILEPGFRKTKRAKTMFEDLADYESDIGVKKEQLAVKTKSKADIEEIEATRGLTKVEEETMKQTERSIKKLEKNISELANNIEKTKERLKMPIIEEEIKLIKERNKVESELNTAIKKNLKEVKSGRGLMAGKGLMEAPTDFGPRSVTDMSAIQLAQFADDKPFKEYNRLDSVIQKLTKDITDFTENVEEAEKLGQKDVVKKYNNAIRKTQNELQKVTDIQNKSTEAIKHSEQARRLELDSMNMLFSQMEKFSSFKIESKYNLENMMNTALAGFGGGVAVSKYKPEMSPQERMYADASSGLKNTLNNLKAAQDAISTYSSRLKTLEIDRLKTERERESMLKTGNIDAVKNLDKQLINIAEESTKVTGKLDTLGTVMKSASPLTRILQDVTSGFINVENSMENINFDRYLSGIAGYTDAMSRISGSGSKFAREFVPPFERFITLTESGFDLGQYADSFERRQADLQKQILDPKAGGMARLNAIIEYGMMDETKASYKEEEKRQRTISAGRGTIGDYENLIRSINIASKAEGIEPEHKAKLEGLSEYIASVSKVLGDYLGSDKKEAEISKAMEFAFINVQKKTKEVKEDIGKDISATISTSDVMSLSNPNKQAFITMNSHLDSIKKHTSYLVKDVVDDTNVQTKTLLGVLFDTIMSSSIKKLGGDPDKPAEMKMLGNIDITADLINKFNDGVDKNVESQTFLGTVMSNLADKIVGGVGTDTEKKAAGGRMFGSGGPKADKIPAMLSNGEFVINTASAKKLGYANLEHMNNNGAIPGFAKGGVIDNVGKMVKYAWSGKAGREKDDKGLLDFLIDAGTRTLFKDAKDPKGIVQKTTEAFKYIEDHEKVIDKYNNEALSKIIDRDINPIDKLDMYFTQFERRQKIMLKKAKTFMAFAAKTPPEVLNTIVNEAAGTYSKLSDVKEADRRWTMRAFSDSSEDPVVRALAVPGSTGHFIQEGASSLMSGSLRLIDYMQKPDKAFKTLGHAYESMKKILGWTWYRKKEDPNVTRGVNGEIINELNDKKLVAWKELQKFGPILKEFINDPLDPDVLMTFFSGYSGISKVPAVLKTVKNAGEAAGKSATSVASSITKNKIKSVFNLEKEKLMGIVGKAVKEADVANLVPKVGIRSSILHGSVGADKLKDLKDIDVIKKAIGGRVFGEGGPRGDKIPAMLSPGEYVLKTEAAKKLGYANLEQMNNSGEVPGFSNGGLFGGGAKQAGKWTDWLSKKRLDIADKLFEKKGKAKYKDSGFISAGMKEKADSMLYKAQDLGTMGLLAAGEMFTRVGVKGPLELMSMLEKGKSVIDEKGVSGAYKEVVKGTAKGMEFVAGLDKEKVSAIGSSIGTAIKEDIKKGGMGISSGVLETLIPTGAGSKLIKNIAKTKKPSVLDINDPSFLERYKSLKGIDIQLPQGRVTSSGKRNLISALEEFDVLAGKHKYFAKKLGKIDLSQDLSIFNRPGLKGLFFDSSGVKDIKDTGFDVLGSSMKQDKSAIMLNNSYFEKKPFFAGMLDKAAHRLTKKTVKSKDYARQLARHEFYHGIEFELSTLSDFIKQTGGSKPGFIDEFDDLYKHINAVDSGGTGADFLSKYSQSAKVEIFPEEGSIYKFLHGKTKKKLDPRKKDIGGKIDKFVKSIENNPEFDTFMDTAFGSSFGKQRESMLRDKRVAMVMDIGVKAERDANKQFEVVGKLVPESIKEYIKRKEYNPKTHGDYNEWVSKTFPDDKSIGEYALINLRANFLKGREEIKSGVSTGVEYANLFKRKGMKAITGLEYRILDKVPDVKNSLESFVTSFKGKQADLFYNSTRHGDYNEYMTRKMTKSSEDLLPSIVNKFISKDKENKMKKDMFDSGVGTFRHGPDGVSDYDEWLDLNFPGNRGIGDLLVRKLRDNVIPNIGRQDVLELYQKAKETIAKPLLGKEVGGVKLPESIHLNETWDSVLERLGLGKKREDAVKEYFKNDRFRESRVGKSLTRRGFRPAPKKRPAERDDYSDVDLDIMIRDSAERARKIKEEMGVGDFSNEKEYDKLSKFLLKHKKRSGYERALRFIKKDVIGKNDPLSELQSMYGFKPGTKPPSGFSAKSIEPEKELLDLFGFDDLNKTKIGKFAGGGVAGEDKQKREDYVKGLLEYNEDLTKKNKERAKHEEYRDADHPELSSFYKDRLKKYKTTRDGMDIGAAQDPSSRGHAFMLMTAATEKLIGSKEPGYPYDIGKASSDLNIGKFDYFTDEKKHGAGILDDQSVKAARGKIERRLPTDVMLESLYGASEDQLKLAFGAKIKTAQNFIDKAKSGEEVPLNDVKMLYGMFSKSIKNTDLKGQLDDLKSAKEYYMDRLTSSKSSKLIRELFQDPEAYIEKLRELNVSDDFKEQVEDILKGYAKAEAPNTPLAWAKEMSAGDKRLADIKNQRISQRHSGGPVFKDGLHNLQKGEFVIPKHFQNGGKAAGGTETVVVEIANVFDDFLNDLSTMFSSVKISAPEFPELIIGNLDEARDSLEIIAPEIPELIIGNLDEVRNSLEVTVPEIPNIMIEDIDKLTSLSIDGIENLDNIPDQIRVVVEGNVETGDTSISDIVTNAINDALRNANVGADGRDDLAEVFNKIHDDILNINSRSTENTDNIEILNKDVNDLEHDYKSHKSELITTENELRTFAVDLTNGVKGDVRINYGSISELERELRMIKTRITSSESRQVIG